MRVVLLNVSCLVVSEKHYFRSQKVFLKLQSETKLFCISFVVLVKISNMYCSCILFFIILFFSINYTINVQKLEPILNIFYGFDAVKFIIFILKCINLMCFYWKKCESFLLSTSSYSPCTYIYSKP